MQPGISVPDSRGLSFVALRGAVNCIAYFRDSFTLPSQLKIVTLLIVEQSVRTFAAPPPAYPPLCCSRNLEYQHQRGPCIAACALLSLALEGFPFSALRSSSGGVIYFPRFPQTFWGPSMRWALQPEIFPPRFGCPKSVLLEYHLPKLAICKARRPRIPFLLFRSTFVTRTRQFCHYSIYICA